MSRLQVRLTIFLLVLFSVLLHFTFFNWSSHVIGQHFADFFCDDDISASCLRISYGEQASERMFLASLVGVVVPLAFLCIAIFLTVREFEYARRK
jgi:hypothetical protein